MSVPPVTDVACTQLLQIRTKEQLEIMCLDRGLHATGGKDELISRLLHDTEQMYGFSNRTERELVEMCDEFGLTPLYEQQARSVLLTHMVIGGYIGVARAERMNGNKLLPPCELLYVVLTGSGRRAVSQFETDEIDAYQRAWSNDGIVAAFSKNSFQEANYFSGDKLRGPFGDQEAGVADIVAVRNRIRHPYVVTEQGEVIYGKFDPDAIIDDRISEGGLGYIISEHRIRAKEPGDDVSCDGGSICSAAVEADMERDEPRGHDRWI